MNTVYQPHKSSLGNLDANIVMLIAYVGSAILSWIPFVSYVAFAVPIAVFFLEKNSPFVKFHAAQSAILSLVHWLLAIVIAIIIVILTSTGILTMLGIIWVLNIVSILISLAILALVVICCLKSWKYEAFKLPVIGDIAAKFSK